MCVCVCAHACRVRAWMKYFTAFASRPVCVFSCKHPNMNFFMHYPIYVHDTRHVVQVPDLGPAARSIPFRDIRSLSGRLIRREPGDGFCIRPVSPGLVPVCFMNESAFRDSKLGNSREARRGMFLREPSYLCFLSRIFPELSEFLTNASCMYMPGNKCVCDKYYTHVRLVNMQHTQLRLTQHLLLLTHALYILQQDLSSRIRQVYPPPKLQVCCTQSARDPPPLFCFLNRKT
jgi:hypothetical protein